MIYFRYFRTHCVFVHSNSRIAPDTVTHRTLYLSIRFHTSKMVRGGKKQIVKKILTKVDGSRPVRLFQIIEIQI